MFPKIIFTFSHTKTCVAKFDRGANVADGIDTALSVTSVGLAASGVGLLSTIIAAPVTIGLQWGDCVWAAGGRRKIGRQEASSKSQET